MALKGLSAFTPKGKVPALVILRSFVDVSQSTITIEATGNLEKLNGLLLLRPYGILELARTGLVALERGASVLQVTKN